MLDSRVIAIFLLGLKKCHIGAEGHEEFMEENDFAFAERLISSECDVCLGFINTGTVLS
jgi:hypothetical protein